MGPHDSVRWETAVNDPLLEQGRMARLAIRGQMGALDIYVNYWRAGETAEDRDARCASIAKLARLLRPRHQVLSILGGDWNYVPTREDRWCASTGRHTGHKDHREQVAWNGAFRAPGYEKLTEFEQDDYTWTGNNAKSRLDRVYSSHSLED